MMVQLDGKPKFYFVADAWHAATADNERVKYYVMLECRDDLRDRWAKIESYLE
jgi:hypothetical protein